MENARATPPVKECWKYRLQALKKELGSEGAPLFEQLLIQQAALLAKIDSYGVELFKRDEAIHYADARYLLGETTNRSAKTSRVCETLARVRKLSRNIPALQVNIATEGGQQVNLA